MCDGVMSCHCAVNVLHVVGGDVVGPSFGFWCVLYCVFPLARRENEEGQLIVDQGVRFVKGTLEDLG